MRTKGDGGKADAEPKRVRARGGLRQRSPMARTEGARRAGPLKHLRAGAQIAF
jgi:hypothetical protein